MKKIGLTGGTGFIGQWLIREYAERYRFTTITHREEISGLLPNSEYIRMPYDRDGFSSAFKGCDVIVHLGAAIPDRVTDIGTMAQYMGNILSSEALFQAAVDCGVKKVINISSVSVYNKRDPMPLTEEAKTEPDNCYGVSKAVVEDLADIYSRRYGFSLITLRVSQVLGYKRNNSGGFYHTLFNSICEGKEVSIYGEGKAARDYIYVKDVAAAVSYAIEAGGVTGVFNIGGGKPISNTQLAEAYISGIASTSKITHVDVENEDNRYWYLDISKAEKLLGFAPSYDMSAAAADMKKVMESGIT